jgi:hypothetical protein
MTGLALRGFATINFWAADVAAARAWYADFLGTPAYFERSEPTAGSFTPSFAWVITRLS